jgi:hypothetical protein
VHLRAILAQQAPHGVVDEPATSGVPSGDDHADVNGDHADANGVHADVTGDHADVTGDHADVTGDHADVTGDHADVTSFNARRCRRPASSAALTRSRTASG